MADRGQLDLLVREEGNGLDLGRKTKGYGPFHTEEIRKQSVPIDAKEIASEL
jgi:hypothetical protein